MNNGFIVTATYDKKYLKGIEHLTQSILDFYPSAKIHLFVDDQNYQLLDKYVKKSWFYDITIAPSLYRAKLWSLNKTSFDRVCYLDADMICASEEISNVFDLVEKNDLVFTKIREEAGATCWWNPDQGESCPHGGFFVYQNNPKMQEFLEQWHEYYEQTYSTSKQNWTWHHSNPKYTYRRVHLWDQFPLYLMLCDKKSIWYKPHIKWDYIDGDDWKWNYIFTNYNRLDIFSDKYNMEESYIIHYPSWMLSEDRISTDFHCLLQQSNYEED